MNRFPKRPFQLSPNKRALLEWRSSKKGSKHHRSSDLSQTAARFSTSLVCPAAPLVSGSMGACAPRLDHPRAFSLLGELNLAMPGA